MVAAWKGKDLKHTRLLSIFLATCSVLMSQQSTEKIPSDPGSATTRQNEAASASLLEKVRGDMEASPEFQRQRQQFLSVIQSLDSDLTLRGQREKMSQDLKTIEKSAEFQLQRNKLQNDLRPADGSPGMAEHKRSLQSDVDRVRPGASSPRTPEK